MANQFALLIRKYPFPKGTVNTDPEGAATKKFLQSERKCARMNKFFSLLSRRNPYAEDLRRMRSFIEYVIGVAPNHERISQLCDFGSGASIGVHGNQTHLGMKISVREWTVSASALVYGFNAVMDHAQLRDVFWEKRGPYYCFDGQEAFKKFLARSRITKNNKISFVPKTVKTHRAIAVEPLVNGFLQKGVDEFLRLLLRRVGIDLRDQTRNQKMAREGSLSDNEDSFVTMDLSSASDSISIGLVRDLLPPDWFYLLDSIRSKSFELNGKLYTYHKFCSMGNGFCFPLETLIFVAVCVACGCGVPGTDFSVYGDDIIVRKKHAARVAYLLNKIGFSLNKDKTFLEGPFRESCGSDWFGGKAVRPYTLDYAFDSIENIFKFLNFTRKNPLLLGFFSDVRPLVLGWIPPQFQFTRPVTGNEDTGIDCDFTEFLSNPGAVFDKKQQTWTWLELQHRAVPDQEPFDVETSRIPAEVYGLLRGATSIDRKLSYRGVRLVVGFTLRRKVQTFITRNGYSGATSTWLPPLAA